MASSSSKLSVHDGLLMADPTLYRITVGSLQYLSFTRLDLSFVVNKVCQFMHTPKDIHWQAVKCNLCYLRGTADYGLLLHPSSSFQLTAYSDADWTGCPDDRQSTSAFLIYFGSSLISWSSHKQPSVARSSTEAE